MKTRASLGLALSAAALLGAAATSQAQSFSLNFDGPGDFADDFAPIFLTIGFGQFVPTLDSFGDPIPGSDHWEIDPLGGDVPVIDPSTVGYGTAPSPGKALDARDGPVLLVFDTPLAFDSFSAALDNSTFGNLSGTDVQFFDVSNSLLFSAPVDQSTPGFVVNVGAIGAVKSVLLPPTAFYDDITFAAVPEPSLAALLGLSVPFFAMRRRRA
jgi:hypothetical protein